MIGHNVIDYYKIQDKIDNNEIIYEEGYVDNFKTPSKPTFFAHQQEEFYLNGVYFCYYHELYGYSRFANDGGIIKENGQHLRIGYIEHDGRNVIVSIQIIW